MGSSRRNLLFLAAFLLSSPAWAEEKPHVQAALASEVLSFQPGKPFWVALRLRMDPGWHTYWQYAGDSGLPTKAQWNLPAGFQAGPFQWPSPERIEAPPLVSYGYSGEVFLLTQITPPARVAGENAALSARVDWLECADVCIPGRAELSLSLPVKNEAPMPDPAWTEAFARTRAALPLTTSPWTIALHDAGDAWQIQGSADNQEAPRRVLFFPARTGLLEEAAPQTMRPAARGFVLTLRKDPESSPTELDGVLVSDQGWRGPGSEKALSVRLSPEGAPAPETGFHLGLALLFAFLGGLLLNLMPCVLPVLSLKILSFVQQSHAGEARPWRHGAVFAAGVILSFWALAGLLLALRGAGQELGWGFQLQSPLFVAGLACFFFLFGLNLLGIFEIGASLTSAARLTSGRQGLAASFWSGVLATLVATPCTAPFMGAALGFALTQSAAVSFLIFTSLGAGMAFPYVVLSSAPRLLRFVPKPGAWTETLKQIMGFLLLATVIWLAWVLGVQKGMTAVAGLLGAFLCLGIAAWVLGRWAHPAAGPRQRLGAQVAALCFLAVGFCVALVAVKAGSPAVSNQAAGRVAWQPFSPESVAKARAEGKPVFVDFTAAWCLTCQVNERVALEVPSVKAKFEAKGVVLFKADWTSRDETITRALRDFGRQGVPLYVLYGSDPKAPPTLLPEILTPQIVLDALYKI